MTIPENNNPKISVVTVCYNAASEIERTIKSVINQTYSNVEYIIIDGGSKDATVDIIKKYADKVTYWVSEPDKGIYDAMNKGIIAATGDWINFMNAGDWFYDSKVLDKVAQEMKTNPNVGVFYGNVYIVKEHYHFFEKPIGVAHIKNYMPFYHQATFVNLKYHKEHLFDVSFRISADYNFFHTAICADMLDAMYINYPIAYYDCRGGISKELHQIVIEEEARIQGISVWVTTLKKVIYRCKQQLKSYLFTTNQCREREKRLYEKNGKVLIPNNFDE